MTHTHARHATHTRTRGLKRTAIVLAAVLTFSGAATAFAYWTAIGSGTGEATTGESVSFVVTTESASGEIAPGSDGEAIDFTVTNPGTGTLHLSEVTVTLADATGEPWVPVGACLAADYSVSITTAPVSGAIAGGGSVDGTVTVVLDNTAANQDACQGQVIPLYFVAS
jgi:hypothetical protein